MYHESNCLSEGSLVISLRLLINPADRHVMLKLLPNLGESFTTDDYMCQVQRWFEKGIWSSHIEVLDKPKKQKRF